MPLVEGEGGAERFVEVDGCRAVPLFVEGEGTRGFVGREGAERCRSSKERAAPALAHATRRSAARAPSKAEARR